jgi:GntR family transcriptional regulator
MLTNFLMAGFPRTRPGSNAISPVAGVDSELPTPLYHQIYLILREQIRAGAFEARSRLPTEVEISAEYSVSRITAKRALDELAADGLVVRRRGRGTSVVGKVASEPVEANINGLIENLLMVGLETKVDILEFEYVAASSAVRAALKLGNGDQVQRAVRVRRYNGLPLSYSTSFVPAAIGRGYTARDLARKPLLALLEKAGCLIGSADQTVSAVLAEPAVAKVLEVPLGSPLLSVVRTVYEQRGRAVEHIAILYRPDRYQYRTKLARVRGPATRMWSHA